MAGFDESKVTELKGLLAKLKETDTASAVAECVKELGVKSLTECGVLDALVVGFADKSKEGELAVGACKTFKALVEAIGMHFEPYAIPLIPKITPLYDSKSKAATAAANEAALCLINAVNTNAVRMVLPALYVSFKAIGWKEKVGALGLLSALSVHAKGKVGMCLVDIVPAITDCLWDTKKDTQRAAIEALTQCCTVVENPDLRPIVPHVISALARPDEVPACMDKLLSVVFVQTVDSPSLSIIVPLLARGLRNRDEGLKRKCCVVIDNMCKLVLNPEDAAPFGPKLLPEIKRVVDECAMEEVRKVGERALISLEGCLEAKPDH